VIVVRNELFIDGAWVRAKAGRESATINPATGQILTMVAEGDRDDAQAAIAAARQAFDSGIWSEVPAPERGALVARLGDLIEANAEDLARLETLDTGKTLEESRWDMRDITGIFRYFGGLADKDGGEVIAAPNPGATSLLVREPVGVCGQISPWNYPLLQAAWKMAPALAAGCTIVVKPSELTPLTTLRVTELAEEVGFPAGVFNTVLGPGDTVGAELAENTDVDLISFTGGIVTGKKIMRAASANVKKVALELGGKNPNIVFDDADFELALDYALNAVFFHAGQICSAGARLMLQDGIHDAFVEALLARIRKIRLGDGLADGTQMGPLISEAHRAKVEGSVAIAQAEGARLVCGGARPDDPALAAGFYYLPTLLTGCTNAMRVVQEEVFGPVITVERFSSEEEAVRRANSTIYGLSAGFWTRDPDRIHRLAGKLRFGTVWINDFNVYFTQAPWGGYKQSGLGRELGRLGLEEYQEVKHVYQNHAGKPALWFGV